MKNKKLLVGIIGILIILLGIVYVFVFDYPDKLDIYINDSKITLSSSDEDNILNLNSLNSQRKTLVKIKSLKKINVRVNGKKVFNYLNTNIGKLNINEENQIKLEIKFKNDKDYRIYYINTLPDNFLEYTSENNGDNYDGDYFMTTYTADQATSYVFKANNSGDILYYKKCEGFCSQFRKETSSKGKARYVYTAQDMDAGAELDMANLSGKLIVMDDKYRVIDEVKYIENSKTNNDKTYTIFEYLDDNHYLVTTSSREKSTTLLNNKEVMLVENNIQEIKNGKILFEWRSSEHKELYDYIIDKKTISVDADNDYLHINKLIVDPEDNNLIASFRSISAILKIDRNTGEIIWTLGGNNDDFNLTKYQKFGYQHSLSFTSDHSLMIFDNGDNRPAMGIKNESRVVKIKLDEQNKKVLEYKDYKLDNVYSMAMGSVQVIDEENEVYLISFGTGIFSEGPVKLIDFKNNKTLFTFNLLSNKMMFTAQKTK